MSSPMRKNPPKKFKKTKSRFINPVQKAFSAQTLLDTLRYRQIFDCPMSCQQIWNYLISNKSVEAQDFKRTLDDLVRDKKILQKDGWYSISKIDYEKVEGRKKRAEKLIAQAKHIAKHLKQIPWIEMAAVTGSVAAFNAGEQSDIDLLVVTKPKRLWLTRLFLVLTLKILGVYWNAKKPTGTICPNILTTTDNLTWDSNKQNLYIANEVSLLYPIFFRHNCYFDFLKQNDWVKNYLPNFTCYDRGESHSTLVAGPRPAARDFPESLWDSPLLSHIVDLLELIAMKIQIHYMKNKKTTEVVSKNFIHFNTNDSSAVILRRFTKNKNKAPE